MSKDKTFNDLDGDFNLDDDFEDETIPKKWLYQNNKYTAISEDSSITSEMKPGYYKVGLADYKYIVYPVKPKFDKVHLVRNDLIDKLILEIDSFWNKTDVFKKYKMVHKRGILLTGHPGTGKTTLINLLANELIKVHKGVVFNIQDVQELSLYTGFVNNELKKIQPDLKIITVIEDIDELYKQSPSFILNFLNGRDQIANNLVVATTNKLHELDDLIIRPSRFDWILEVDKPNKEERFAFLLSKGLAEEESLEWANKTDEMTYAELKELFISVKIFDNDIDDQIAKIKKQSSMVDVTTYQGTKKKKAGFK